MKGGAARSVTIHCCWACSINSVSAVCCNDCTYTIIYEYARKAARCGKTGPWSDMLAYILHSQCGVKLNYNILTSTLFASLWYSLITVLVFFNILFVLVFVLEFCCLFCEFSVFVLFCVLFLILYCLFPIFVQVYRPLPPGGNPTEVNKYHIISHHTVSYIISHHIIYHISHHITSYHISYIYHIISYHISYHIIYITSYIISYIITRKFQILVFY